MPATLFVVATPIGNLEDLTIRARRVLSECDLVAAEDTRRTRQLLTHLGISKPLVSYYQPREDRQIKKIIAALNEGRSVALVCDGGTPAISDPGYRLVRAALEAGINVSPIPGPSALAAALSASGLPTDRVTFAGFPPPKSAARQRTLAELADRRDTLVFYESPRRIGAFLADALAVLGDREAVVWRELTKEFEERRAGSLDELAAYYEGREVKGEVTVLIRGAAERDAMSEDDLIERLREELALSDRPLSAIASDLARESGLPRKRVYALALRIKDQGGVSF